MGLVEDLKEPGYAQHFEQRERVLAAQRPRALDTAGGVGWVPSRPRPLGGGRGGGGIGVNFEAAAAVAGEAGRFRSESGTGSCRYLLPASVGAQKWDLGSTSS